MRVESEDDFGLNGPYNGSINGPIASYHNQASTNDFFGTGGFFSGGEEVEAQGGAIENSVNEGEGESESEDEGEGEEIVLEAR